MAKKPFEDDGRTIADMSGVDRPSLLGSWFGIRLNKGKKGEKNDDGSEPLTKKQNRMYMSATLLAALAIGGVFIAAGAIAIAVMLALWAH